LYQPRSIGVSDEDVGTINIIFVAFFNLVPNVKVGFAVVAPKHGDLFAATSNFVIFVVEAVNFAVHVFEYHDGGSITLAKAVKGAIATATEDATVVIDLRDSNYFEITLGANVTDIDFTNGSVGQRFIIRFEQPAGANYTIVYSAVTHDLDGGGSPAAVTVSWPGGTAPTMTATNDKADTYGFIVRAEGHFDGYVIGQNIAETTN
jgi:hypothetical protein